MDRRLIAIIVSAALLTAVVVAVVVARGGSSDDATDTSARPTIEVPDDPPPSDLEVEDLVTGDGPEAAAGDQITVEYVGADYSSGEEFDSSWERIEPFQFQLGSGMVIPGWDQGIEGMRVGGRRQLVIPPDLAYGKRGDPPAIAPNATLLFVIDLVSID